MVGTDCNCLCIDYVAVRFAWGLCHPEVGSEYSAQFLAVLESSTPWNFGTCRHSLDLWLVDHGDWKALWDLGCHGLADMHVSNHAPAASTTSSVAGWISIAQ